MWERGKNKAASICLFDLTDPPLTDPTHSKTKPASPLRPHPVSSRLEVPSHIPRPPYVGAPEGTQTYDESEQSHDAAGIAAMRAAGALAARVLDFAGTLAKPGVTTDEIDKAVHTMTVEAGAYPSPLTYSGFPKSVCTSVNECICHGIPDGRALQSGDIVNIDVTVFLDGHHGDTSRTFAVGPISDDARRLIDTTERALAAAIATCAPGVRYNKIGETIQAIADAERLGVVREFVGHGVGRVFHSNPVILHHKNREPGTMTAGTTFTIEPMLTLGSAKPRMWGDGWTCVTADGSLSAQAEHTLLVTEGGVEILTKNV